MAFLVEWYIVSSFFHCFYDFLGKNPPCLAVKFVSVGIGGALHVISMVEEMFVTIHPCLFVLVFIGGFSFSLVLSRLVSVFILFVLFSKNFILNISMFSGRIGFTILIFVSVGGICILDIKVLGGMFSITGWWSKLSCWFVFVLAS
jgi:hypothetical protein